MTAYRVATIACNGDRCVRAEHAYSRGTTVPRLRAVAHERGWRYAHRKDWCPDHAAELGLSPPRFQRGDRVQWFADGGQGPELTGWVDRVERDEFGELVAYIHADVGTLVCELVDDLGPIKGAS